MKQYFRMAKPIYLKITYFIIAMLASIFASELNATVRFDSGHSEFPRYREFPRYQWCKLAGTKEQIINNSCVRITDARYWENGWGIFDASKSPDKDIVNAQQQIFGILVTIAVLNSILLVMNLCGCVECSVPNEPGNCLGWFEIRWYFSVINTGLTISVVAWLFSIENIGADYNVENNIYFEKYNIIAIAIAMLVISIVDVLVIVFEWYNFPLHWGYDDNGDYFCWNLKENLKIARFKAHLKNGINAVDVPQDETLMTDNPLRF